MTFKSWSGMANTPTDTNAETRDYAIMLLAEHGYRAGEYNPHSTQPWEVGNEFGSLCIVIADDIGAALDAAVDNGYMDSEKMSDEDEQEYHDAVNDLDEDEWIDPPDTFRAGNASELFDSPYLWIHPLNMLA